MVRIVDDDNRGGSTAPQLDTMQMRTARREKVRNELGAMMKVLCPTHSFVHPLPSCTHSSPSLTHVANADRLGIDIGMSISPKRTMLSLCA
jgi:hypothetical protein